MCGAVKVKVEVKWQMHGTHTSNGKVESQLLFQSFQMQMME